MTSNSTNISSVDDVLFGKQLNVQRADENNNIMIKDECIAQNKDLQSDLLRQVQGAL